MANGPRLKIDIVEKRFAVLPAPLLVDFHLEVEPSTVVALVGPSGVGKSSLLRMVAGVDNDYSGSITVDGVAAAEAPPAGFVFQDARLLPWLTAVQNIRAVRRETTEAEASELLARVGLAGYGNAYPRELSGGMQRRVALARALSVNPRLLLLDEPFVSLDRNLVVEMQEVFLDLVRAHAPTVILVTHLAEDAARLADRAIVLARMPVRIVADIALSPPRDLRNSDDLIRLSGDITAPAPEASP
jgi:NitT/TauT family transport system ATP-binding protein/sulfonate transport system ATP-binding protein